MTEFSSPSKRVVLLTGCSSGLGLALADRLMQSGRYHVIATCNQSSISGLQDRFAGHELLDLDLTDDSAISQLVNSVCEKFRRIDVLINNAAICFRAVVEHMDYESELLLLRTNYLGPMSLIRSVLPIMREQRRGYILNVSAVSGMFSMPTMASFSASKQALEGACEALWYEARPYGINVTLVQPGFFHSDSLHHIELAKKAALSSRVKGPHSEYYASMNSFFDQLLSWSRESPERAAKKIERLLDSPNPPLRLLLTRDAKLFAFLRHALPSQAFHRILFSMLPGSHAWGLEWLRRQTSR